MFGQSGCLRPKVVVFGQSCCIREKNDCYRTKWLYLGKVVVIGKSGCNCAKVVLFGQ